MKYFKFNHHDNTQSSLEIEVNAFCENNGVQKLYCDGLFAEANRQVRDLIIQEEKGKINLEEPVESLSRKNETTIVRESPPSEFSIPLQLNEENGVSNVVFYVYKLYGKITLESSVYTFCERYNIQAMNCETLLFEAFKQLEVINAQVLKAKTKLPNSHLDRIDDASTAEMLNIKLLNNTHYPSNHMSNDVLISEKQFDEIIYAQYNQSMQFKYKGIYSQHENVFNFNNKDNNDNDNNNFNMDSSNVIISNKICFIHSCSLKQSPNSIESNHAILYQLLETLELSNLLSQLDSVWIINYGDSYISQHITEMLKKYQNTLHWIQRSKFTHHFEIPTLRHLHHLIKRLEKQPLVMPSIYDTTNYILQSKVENF